MFVLKSFIILAIGMYGSYVSAAGCKFSNDDAIKNEPDGGQDYNVSPNPGSTWRNVNGKTTVLYIMDRSVNSHTKNAYLQVMRELERGSCVIFKETTSTNQKYLTLKAGRDCYDRDDTGVAGGVTTGTALNQNQTLELDHKLCSSNSRDNVDYLKVVRHEFLHVFGLMHTQTRWDRNNYVWVDTSNIEDTKEARYQYEICMDCKTFDAPYECNSIMHYKANTYAKNPNKDVMYSKVCKINPGNTLTDWDWKLLNKAAKCPGS